MKTALNQNQVLGTGFPDIKQELISLKDKARELETAQQEAATIVNQKVGHFHGQVENEADLFGLNVPNDSQVFVKAKNQYYRKTSLGWGAILGGGTGSSGGNNSGGGDNYEQITALGVVAPYNFSIHIPPNPELTRPPLEVLRLHKTEAVTVTDVTFPSTDADSFLHTKNMVVFDGKMKVNNSVDTVMAPDGVDIYRTKVKKSDYKFIHSIEVT